MIISEKNQQKKLSNNILSLAQEAKKAKDLNHNVINSTIGMLADENNEFYTFKAVKEVMANLSDYRKFSYSDTDGGANFEKAILTWVFGDSLSQMQKKHLSVIATPGGSGAIGVVFSNYMQKNDKVLLPKNMWETYITFAKERECDYITYDLFNEAGRFDLESVKKGIDSLLDQDTIVLVINDPCQNPTGFCLSDGEYDSLVNLLNSYQKNMVLLMDMAYFDYYSSNGEIIRKRYEKLLKLNDHVLTVFAFSGSKSFGLYGLRIGAAIALHQNQKEVEFFKSSASYLARSYWSSSSTLGINIIEELVLNETYQEMFQKELKVMSSILEERAKVFLDEANKWNLKLLPFERGFFVCVPTNDPVGLMNALHEDECYVVVTKTCIRIALCAISIKEAKKLPEIIKKCMDNGGF